MVAGEVALPSATPEPHVRAFPSRGSSEHGPLSLAPCAVNGVVTLSVQQRGVFAVVVRVIAVAMVHFHHVLCHEA
jgi:hypothetical protein